VIPIEPIGPAPAEGEEGAPGAGQEGTLSAEEVSALEELIGESEEPGLNL
jgi:hypothetical protein